MELGEPRSAEGDPSHARGEVDGADDIDGREVQAIGVLRGVDHAVDVRRRARSRGHDVAVSKTGVSWSNIQPIESAEGTRKALMVARSIAW